jgi:hypothetical protein
MIDKTYGHLVPDSDEYVRGLLDAYDREEGRRPRDDGLKRGPCRAAGDAVVGWPEKPETAASLV